MIRSLLTVLSPGGGEARLSVLIFHRVLPAPDPLLPGEMDAERFDRLCGWVTAWFNVMPLADACTRLRDGILPPRSMAITFDDGYADNLEVAVPLLAKHGLTATFFIATAYLDGGRMWNDTLIESIRRTRKDRLCVDVHALSGSSIRTGSVAERIAAIDLLVRRFRYLEPTERLAAVGAIASATAVDLPSDLMMTSTQVQDLQRHGMAVGAHTVTHPILTRLSTEDACAEIRLGKEHLENLTQGPVRLFAYPNGRPDEDYRAEHVAMVRELGFDAAVTTSAAAARGDEDLYQIPRFTPWDQRRWMFGLRLARNLRMDAKRCTV